jgi:dUTP pyrophosphatase
VILLNTGKEEFHVKKGDRVAQFIFEKITIAEELEEVSHEDLTQTERGANGFGSTGR